MHETSTKVEQSGNFSSYGINLIFLPKVDQGGKFYSW
jgi:hypothetical protein